MKPLTRRILIIVTSGVVIAGTLAACGHHRYHDPEKRGEWIVEKVTDELDLDEAQKTRLELVRQEIFKVRNEMHADRQSARAEILAMLEQPQLDRQKVVAMIEQKTVSVSQHAPRVVNALGEFYDSLSEEQRMEIRKHIAEMGEHHHHHW